MHVYVPRTEGFLKSLTYGEKRISDDVGQVLRNQSLLSSTY